MAPPKSPDPRVVRVQAMLTRGEADEIAGWAAAAGVTVSEVIRAALWPPVREATPNRESRVGGGA